MEKVKIKHDHTCDICGEPATRNIQNTWSSYEITKDGEFINKDSWEGTANEFLCEKCYEKEYM